MERLISKAQSCDETALNALWEKVERFAYATAWRYSATAYADSDDFKQCAWLGFHSAVSAHDGRYSFLSLVQWHIQRECRTLLGLRMQKSPRDALPLDALSEDGETPFIEMLEDDALPESSAAMEDADLYRDVHTAVSALPERERLVIVLHYFKALTLSEIAQRMQVSTQRATQLKDRALSHLRQDPVLSAVYAPDFRVLPRPERSSLRRFRHTHMSDTEAAALLRISQQKRAARGQLAKYRRWMAQNVTEGLFTPEEAEAVLARRKQELGI